MHCPKYVANSTLSLGWKKVAIIQINLKEEKKILFTTDKDTSLNNIYFKEIYKFFNIINKTIVVIIYQKVKDRVKSNILINKGRII